MKIVVPVNADGLCAAPGNCEALRFYEDDHGRVTKRVTEPVKPEEALALIEKRGVDVLLCRGLTREEQTELAASGLLLAEAAAEAADDALRAYLGAAIACDPSNNCNYCGHKSECALPHD